MADFLEVTSFFFFTDEIWHILEYRIFEHSKTQVTDDAPLTETMSGDSQCFTH